MTTTARTFDDYIDDIRGQFETLYQHYLANSYDGEHDLEDFLETAIYAYDVEPSGELAEPFDIIDATKLIGTAYTDERYTALHTSSADLETCFESASALDSSLRAAAVKALEKEPSASISTAA